MSGKYLKSEYSKVRSGDLDSGYRGIAKGEKVLGYKPKIGLEEELKELLASANL